MTGGRVYSVPTGSMQPVIKPGDAVLTKPVGSQQLQVGQVISYRDRDAPWLITTHRVVSINHQLHSLTTKGDHNSQPDLPIATQQVVGQVTMVGPRLGKLLSWLRRPIGLALVIYLPALTLMYIEANRLLRRQAIYYGR